MYTGSKTTAIILAAGRGRRLGNLTERVPKCLLKIGKLPILHYQLSALEKNGIKKVIVVTGFMSEKVRKYALGHFPSLNFTFVRNPFFETTNTLYSLALAAEVARNDATVIQLNGDVVFDSRVIENMLSINDGKSYIATQKKTCGEEEIKVIPAGSGFVSLLNKSVNPDNAIGEAIGINKFCSSFWSAMVCNLCELSDKFPNEYFEYAIEKTIENGNKIFPFSTETLKVLEIDYPHDFERAQKEFVTVLP